MIDTKTIRLSANENCYGCSPLALEAIQKRYKDVHLYPEVFPNSLKRKLAEKFGVSANNIVVGAGSVKIIDELIRTFVGPDDEILTFEKSFIAYTQLSEIYKLNYKLALQENLRCVPDNLLPLITDKTKLIFIANPNNPTGTIITHAELEGFLKAISSKIIVVIDEAYGEYITDFSFPKSLELQKKYPNLVILHSFSKIYGLAGLRIGYGIMEETIASILNANQVPYSLSYLSSDAAIAALSDKLFVCNSARANAEQRDYLYNELKKLGYNTVPTQSNFIYIWFNNDAEKQQVYDLLFENGIIICDLKVFGQEKSMRITIGDKETNNRIISILAK